MTITAKKLRSLYPELQTLYDKRTLMKRAYEDTYEAKESFLERSGPEASWSAHLRAKKRSLDKEKSEAWNLLCVTWNAYTRLKDELTQEYLAANSSPT